MSVASHRFNNDLRRRDEFHPNQTRLTPRYLLEPIRTAMDGIGLDPCTEPDNPCEAASFYTPPADGCELPWESHSVFCNPPYGEARNRWVRRCMEAGKEGTSVALLIPSHTDTKITNMALRECHGSLFVRGRLRFGIPRPNGQQQAASHGSILIGWNLNWAPLMPLGVVMMPMKGEATEVPHPPHRPGARCECNECHEWHASQEGA